MTARSGDALSHVNFQTRHNAVLTESQRARILALGTGSDPRPPQQGDRFPSYLHGGYEAASRNEPGGFASFADYLPKSFHSER
jgi:hypothetical protein